MHILFSLFLSLSANAGTLSSATVPDTVTVGGQALILNGMGLREKYWIDIYAGALYTKSKSSDAEAIIRAEEPKRMEMYFIYGNGVSKEQLNESFDESLLKLANYESLKARVSTLKGLMVSVAANDTIIFDYVPGVGTEIYFNNRKKGTIEGADFMQALWGVFIGPKPPTSALKKGLLGH